MAVLMAEAAGMQAAGLPHGDIDSSCLLQLPVEDVPRNTFSAAEASAGAKPVEEIAGGELGVMNKALDVMDKALGEEMSVMDKALGKEMSVVDKALDIVGKGMEQIVGMKTMELGVVKREQGMEPAAPQKVEGPGPDDDPPHPLVPPLTPATQEEARGAATNGAQKEEARGATKNGTQVVKHVLAGRVLSNPSDWASSTAQVLDLTETDTRLKGFRGGFTDGAYGYLVPFNTAGGHAITTAGLSGLMTRFDLASFNSVEVLDLAANDSEVKGFVGGFHDGTYGYAIPSHFAPGRSGKHGKLPRFDLASFTTFQVLDLTMTDTELKGLFGGFSDGTYGYAIPYYNGVGDGFAGKLPRFDLAGFTTVEVLDLSSFDTRLVGFTGGFTDGTYGYAVPNYRPWEFSGLLTRFDLASFSSVQVLDLAAENTLLSCYLDGFTDGTYGYLLPAHGYGVHGMMPRFDLASFGSVEVLDLAVSDTQLKNFNMGFSDGTYGYALTTHVYGRFDDAGKVVRFDLASFNTFQVLDLTATDTHLRGFMGGFTDGTYGYAVPYRNELEPAGKVPRFVVIQHVPPGPSVSAPGDQSSVVGDPHVVNVAHARFEIRAEGDHKLVQIPQHANRKPDLRVDAKIQHLVSDDCSKSFMTSLTIFGSWTEDAFGLMRITQGSDMPNTTLLINTQSPEEFFQQFTVPDVKAAHVSKAGHASVAFKLRDVSFHVGKHFEGRYGKQRAYLNVRIAGLKKRNDLGGLLGYDDHAYAEKLPANCTAARPSAAYQSSLIGTERSAPITDGGSRIEAE